jgi:phosphocarrier protein
MVSRTVTVTNPLGIHARPAALVVQAAAKFRSEILFSKGDVRGVNGKSIMGVMMLAAEPGAEITVEAEGVDADAAVATLAELLASNFEDRI